MTPAARRRGRTRGVLVRVLVVAALGLSPASCGLSDASRYDEEADQLRTQARRIADDAAQDVSRDPTGTAATAVTAIRSRVPAQPSGHLVAASVPPGTDRAEVRFALDGSVDNYGPGQITARIRLCVVITMTPPPGPTSSIADFDCTGLVPPADSVVAFAG